MKETIFVPKGSMKYIICRNGLYLTENKGKYLWTEYKKRAAKFEHDKAKSVSSMIDDATMESIENE